MTRMRTQLTTDGEALRNARKAAGYGSPSDAWAAFKTEVGDGIEIPSLSTFTRWEHDPARAEPALFAIYCREVLDVEPADISSELGDQAAQITLLLSRKRRRARHPRQPGGDDAGGSVTLPGSVTPPYLSAGQVAA